MLPKATKSRHVASTDHCQRAELLRGVESDGDYDLASHPAGAEAQDAGVLGVLLRQVEHHGAVAVEAAGLVALDGFEGINSAALIWEAIEAKLARGDARG